jgi:hypothetical protein
MTTGELRKSDVADERRSQDWHVGLPYERMPVVATTAHGQSKWEEPCLRHSSLQ